VEEYGGYRNKDEYTQEKLLESSKENNLKFYPGERKYCTFGDEDGTLIGEVFDYILRDGGRSKSFVWKIEGMLR